MLYLISLHLTNQGMNDEYWDDMMTICEYELAEKQREAIAQVRGVVALKNLSIAYIGPAC